MPWEAPVITATLPVMGALHWVAQAPANVLRHRRCSLIGRKIGCHDGRTSGGRVAPVTSLADLPGRQSPGAITAGGVLLCVSRQCRVTGHSFQLLCSRGMTPITLRRR